MEVPKRTLSVEAAGPHLAGLEMIPEPEDQLDLTLLAEHILDTLQHGDELVEQQVGVDLCVDIMPLFALHRLQPCIH